MPPLSRPAVYPRVCGGTRIARRRLAGPQGLSPRVRGNPQQFRPVRIVQGSIPACAGEPQRTARSGISVTVYPRVCGGTRQRPVSAGRAGCLSPRVRGNRPWTWCATPRGLSIPACAGEPPSFSAPGRAPNVYPRVCGGTGVAVAHGPLGQCLSPRVRGNLDQVNIYRFGHLSIPACAGEPLCLPVRNCMYTVYPRVCGGTVSWAWASSPP